MGVPAHVYGFVTKDYHTETAATAIVETIDAIDGERLILMGLSYLCGTTAHTISLMYAKDFAVAGSSRNKTSAHAHSGQKDIVCAVAPKDPAGNNAAAADVIAFQLTDGTWEWDTVGSLAGSTITCTNNITGVDAGGGAEAIAEGGKVMVLGIVADGACDVIGCPASVTTVVGPGELVIAHPYFGEPWYLYDGNATAAGFLNHAQFAYINK
jgi:hypothetical protein